eukprot:631901_1
MAESGQTHSLSTNEHFEQKRLDGCVSFLEAEDGMDIYQLVAFRIMTGRGCRWCSKKNDDDISYDDDDDDNDDCHIWGYWMDIIKAIISVFAQISSVMVLYYHTFDVVMEESGKGWCDADGAWSAKIMAISYISFLSAHLYAKPLWVIIVGAVIMSLFLF